MLTDIFLTFFLVGLNGFFVAAEFAIVKVRASQIEVKINAGSARAKIAKSLVDNLDSYISATQLGITLASLGLGWIGESVVSELVLRIFHAFGTTAEPETIHSISFPIAFISITILHIVFGELIPKALAIRYSLETTLSISLPIKIFYTIFKPFIWLLNGSANFLLRMVGIELVLGHDIHSEEELKVLLTESEEGGAIKRSEHELIQNVFDFDDRIVKQILVPRTKIAALDIDLSDQEIIDKVLEEGYSRLPVYKDSLDNIIGIIYTKDLLKIIKQKDFNIRNIIRPAYFIPTSKKISDLLREFQRQHIHIAIATNEFGGTMGMVTMEDIIEELVGEIQDEYDEEKPLVEKKSENEFIVNSSISISDVNEFLPIALPESPHYDTISGLVNQVFERIPAVNEQKQFGGYDITVLKRHKHSVELVKFKVTDLKEEGERNN